MLGHFGRYELRAKLGDGTMASVYRAYDPTQEREVAIKILRDDWRVNEEVVERFRDEAEMLHRFSHPNIVKCYEYGEADGRLYLVMDYVPNGTLKEWIAEKAPVPPGEAVAFGAAIAEALHFLHEQEVVHRDIKPANVLMNELNQPIITDLGVARLPRDRTLTEVGTVVGSPPYMSPEQAQTGRATGVSDIYALGVVMFELLTRRWPFEGQPLEILYGHVHKQPPRLTSFVPSVPAGLEKVVLTALQKQPHRRYATGAAFAQAMRGAIGQAVGGTTSRSQISLTTGVPPVRKSPLVPIIVGVVVALLILGGGFAGMQLLGGTPAADAGAENSPTAVVALVATSRITDNTDNDANGDEGNDGVGGGGEPTPETETEMVVPDASPTVAASPTDLVVDEGLTGEIASPTPLPSATLPPLVTPVPPTVTPSVVPTQRPTNTPFPTATTPPSPTPPPTATATPQARVYRSVSLAAPINGVRLGASRVTFQWNGDTLAGGDQYVLTVQRGGQNPQEVGRTSGTTFSVDMASLGNFETDWNWWIYGVTAGGTEIANLRTAAMTFGITLGSGDAGSSSGGGGGGDNPTPPPTPPPPPPQ